MVPEALAAAIAEAIAKELRKLPESARAVLASAAMNVPEQTRARSDSGEK